MKWKDMLRSLLFALHLYLALELLLQFSDPPMEHVVAALVYVKTFMIAVVTFLAANVPLG